MIDEILESYPEDEFLKADGFDEAIIGVYDGQWSNNPPRLAYSVKKCIEILMRNMSYEEAVEYFEFNTRGAYMGELTPIFIDDEWFEWVDKKTGKKKRQAMWYYKAFLNSSKEERSILRSKTFPGIARAFAEQWG